MLLTWIYRAIALLFLCLTVYEFLKEKSISRKIGACMVIAPLALRVLMIK